MEEPYRDPTPFEREMLERLAFLSASSDDIRRQAASCRVRSIPGYGDHYGTFEIEVDGERGKRDLRAVVDTLARDVDGALIEAILFSSEGGICEVEIFRPDGSPILRMPRPSEFDLFV